MSTWKLLESLKPSLDLLPTDPQASLKIKKKAFFADVQKGVPYSAILN
jgi:hypothetical protein